MGILEESLKRLVIVAFATAMATEIASKIVEVAHDRWFAKKEDEPPAKSSEEGRGCPK